MKDTVRAFGGLVHSCALHVCKQVGRKFVLLPGLRPAGRRGRSPVMWPEHLMRRKRGVPPTCGARLVASTFLVQLPGGLAPAPKPQGTRVLGARTCGRHTSSSAPRDTSECTVSTRKPVERTGTQATADRSLRPSAPCPAGSDPVEVPPCSPGGREEAGGCHATVAGPGAQTPRGRAMEGGGPSRQTQGAAFRGATPRPPDRTNPLGPVSSPTSHAPSSSPSPSPVLPASQMNSDTIED